MMKELLVFGDKTFKIKVPDDAKITFAPFSPPQKERFGGGGGYNDHKAGTLRIYQGTKDNIIGVFAGVRGFRDTSLDYSEEVAVEQGATIWKSDQHGYEREEKVSSRKEWVDPPALAAAPPSKPTADRKSKPKKKRK